MWKTRQFLLKSREKGKHHSLSVCVCVYQPKYEFTTITWDTYCRFEQSDWNKSTKPILFRRQQQQQQRRHQCNIDVQLQNCYTVINSIFMFIFSFSSKFALERFAFEKYWQAQWELLRFKANFFDFWLLMFGQICWFLIK